MAAVVVGLKKQTETLAVRGQLLGMTDLKKRSRRYGATPPAVVVGLKNKPKPLRFAAAGLPVTDVKKFSNVPQIALGYVGLGQKDQAMDWLERAYGERFSPWVLMRPAFDALRRDPQSSSTIRCP